MNDLSDLFALSEREGYVPVNASLAELVKFRIRKMAPIDKNVLVLQLAPRLNPGYAWIVHSRKSLTRQKRRWMHEHGDLEDFVPVRMTTRRQAANAQEALARQFIRDFQRQGWLTIDENNIVRVVR